MSVNAQNTMSGAKLFIPGLVAAARRALRGALAAGTYSGGPQMLGWRSRVEVAAAFAVVLAGNPSQEMALGSSIWFAR